MVIIFPVRGAVFAGILYLLSVHIDLNRLSDQINGRVLWEQRLENVIKSIWKMHMENYLKSLVCSWVHCFCQWLLTLIWFLHITASGKTLNPWSHPVRTCFAESEYWTIICPSQEASCDPWKDKVWNMKIVLHKCLTKVVDHPFTIWLSKVHANTNNGNKWQPPSGEYNLSHCWITRARGSH